MRPAVKRSLCLTIAAALWSPFAAAETSLDLDARCHVESHYGVQVDNDRIDLTRDSPASNGPARIEFIGSSIHIDGQAIALSAADRKRVNQFESALRALVPQVKQIAAESVDIAFVALSTVVTQYSSDERRADLMDELQTLKKDAEHTIANGNSTDALENADFEGRIEAAVERIVPTLAAEFAAQAIGVAMSGDADVVASFERRSTEFGNQMERVAGAAKALEAKVARLCPQVEALDAIDNSFEWRLPDGSKPELLEFSAQESTEES